VETREGELAALSNKLGQTTTELTNTVEVLRDATNQLSKAWADNKDFVDKAKLELGKRDQSIKELLDDRGKLEQHILSLNTNLGQFDGRIAEVQRKLADSEKARAVVVAQNERLSKLNVYWENLFNDPAALTSRSAQLKKQLAEAAKRSEDTASRTDPKGMKFELLSDGNVRLDPLRKN
jgi:chromosome segregation ATPase